MRSSKIANAGLSLQEWTVAEETAREIDSAVLEAGATQLVELPRSTQ